MYFLQEIMLELLTQRAIGLVRRVYWSIKKKRALLKSTGIPNTICPLFRVSADCTAASQPGNLHISAWHALLWKGLQIIRSNSSRRLQKVRLNKRGRVNLNIPSAINLPRLPPNVIGWHPLTVFFLTAFGSIPRFKSPVLHSSVSHYHSKARAAPAHHPNSHGLNRVKEGGWGWGVNTPSPLLIFYKALIKYRIRSPPWGFSLSICRKNEGNNAALAPIWHFFPFSF